MSYGSDPGGSPLATYALDEESASAVITIDRQDKLNALNEHVVDAIYRYARDASARPEVRTVILTGAGSRAFSAGADLDELASRNHVTESEPMPSPRRELASLLESMPKVTMAVLNGMALGGGLELALACTLRIAASHCTFRFPEVEIGIIPGNGGTQRLPRLVGMGRAMELILTGRKVDAEEAKRIGLVNKVVPADSAMDEGKAWARHLARLSPRAVAVAKSAILSSTSLPLAAGLELEHKTFAILTGSPEKDAAVAECLSTRTRQRE